MNNALVTLFYLLLDLHVGNVLDVLEVVRLVHELVLEEHDVVLVVLFLALVAACLLALVAREHDFLARVLGAVRFGGVVVRLLAVLLGSRDHGAVRTLV